MGGCRPRERHSYPQNRQNPQEQNLPHWRDLRAKLAKSPVLMRRPSLRLDLTASHASPFLPGSFPVRLKRSKWALTRCRPQVLPSSLQRSFGDS